MQNKHCDFRRYSKFDELGEWEECAYCRKVTRFVYEVIRDCRNVKEPNE